MKVFLEKIYWFFWACALYYISAALIYKDVIIDINIHDTYLVAGYFHIWLLMAISYGLVGWLYWMFLKVNFKLIKGLTILYILMTLVAVCFSGFGDKLLQFFIIESDNNITYYKSHDYGIISLLIIIILFVTSKIVFVINTIFGLLKKYFC